MAAPNAELAYAVLDLTAKHPDHLDMAVWVDNPHGNAVGLEELTSENHCGTVACFAGWTAALLGFQIDYTGTVWRNSEWATSDVEAFAARELGLADETAAILFHDTEAADLAGEIEAIFGPRPAVSA